MTTSSNLNRILGGRYVLLAELASGGTGQVYRAYDNQLDKTVAVKVLLKSLNRNPKAIDMIRREANLCLELTHPNIVRLYNLEIADDEIFLVMEFIDGEDLYEYMRKKRRMTMTEVVPVLRQLLEALAAAHAEGVVHMDIKPENVLIKRNGLYKIGDFGISRVYKETGTFGDGYRAKGQQRNVGTRLYMAPEQFQQNPQIGPATDIYALGCVVFEMLTGAPPFYPSDDIVSRKIKEDPVLPDNLNLPRQFAAILRKMLARDPALRHQSAREVLQELTIMEAGLGNTNPSMRTRLRTRNQGPADSGAMDARMNNTVNLGLEPRRRSFWETHKLLILSTLAGIGLVVGFLGWMWADAHQQQVQKSPPPAQEGSLDLLPSDEK